MLTLRVCKLIKRFSHSHKSSDANNTYSENATRRKTNREQGIINPLSIVEHKKRNICELVIYYSVFLRN